MVEASTGQRRNADLLTGWLLSIAGSGALALALVEGTSTLQFIQSARRTDGTVVGLFAGPAHPEVEYADASGIRHTFPGSGWVFHSRGARVRVLFIEREGEPEACLDEWGSLWFSSGITGVIGVAVLLGGVVRLWRR